MTNGSPLPGKPVTGPDRHAVIIAMIGLAIILLIVLIAVLEFPAPVPQGQTNTTGQNIASVATAAITAVGAVIGAYFGVKTANSATEDKTQNLMLLAPRASQRPTEMKTIVGRLSIHQATEALQEADVRQGCGSDVIRSRSRRCRKERPLTWRLQ
jgi:hypothetical protein